MNHDLIKALLIFYKYDEHFATGCEHDVMWVNVRPSRVSEEDTELLADYSFEPTEYTFQSYQWGSC
jgi:hypothetical protein